MSEFVSLGKKLLVLTSTNEQPQLKGRVRPRFFDQVGHETMDAFSENNDFFH